MNVLKNGLIGLGLVEFLAGCNQTPQTSAKLEQSAKSETVAIALEANQSTAAAGKDSAAPGSSTVEVKISGQKVEKTQWGVEVISEASDRPLKSKHEATISETLEPGEYTVIATSPSKAKPVATATIKVI